jgi:acyl-CoA thioester hydrolase
MLSHTYEFRVRYNETDGQGHVHHANYFVYFELGRIEMLRSVGRDYEQLEAQGYNLVVSQIACRYLLPCRFGDTLQLHTTTVRAKGARIQHIYQLFRGEDLLAEGESTVACVDNQGRVRRLPDWLRE